MRIRDPITEGEEPYNLVPLTDMVFNLLIFFMCATTFVQVEKEMTLRLPKTGTASEAFGAPAAEPLVINILQNGNAVISGKTYTDPAALAKRMAEAVGAKKDQVVIIRADEEGIVKHFAAVVRICTQAGVKEAKLVYLDSKGGGNK
jgi:biopolymer transport protein ExbD